jgi:hypothetical protein
VNVLSIINPSLELGYGSMTLSNHDIIRLVGFISKIKIGVVEWICLVLQIDFIYYFIDSVGEIFFTPIQYSLVALWSSSTSVAAFFCQRNSAAAKGFVDYQWLPFAVLRKQTMRLVSGTPHAPPL